MGLRSRAFLAGGLGFAAAFVVACGGSNDLLSGDQSSTLASQLDAVSAAVSSGNCAAANNAADRFTSAVGSLTSPVSSKLVQSLGDGAVKLKQLAARDCSSSSSSSSKSSSTTTTTQSTTTTTTTVTSTPSPTSSSTAQSSTATNPAPPGTTSAPSGGAGLGGGTGTAGSGGTGQ
jgi:hypothetical protein